MLHSLTWEHRPLWWPVHRWRLSRRQWLPESTWRYRTPAMKNISPPSHQSSPCKEKTHSDWKMKLLLANHWLRIYLAEYSYNSYKYICPYINLSISCKIDSILRYLSNFPELPYLFFCPCLILYIYSDFQHIFLSYHFFQFVLKYPL